MNFISQLWWKFMPGTTIKVSWSGVNIIISEDDPRWNSNFIVREWSVGSRTYRLESFDPNNHYRPWLESNVGRQGWDWDWILQEDDIRDNTLTIKFRFGHSESATAAKLLWSR